MKVGEPMTVATDYALAALALGLGWRLWRDAERRGQLAPRLLALTFLWTALGALLGGTAHGFADQLAGDRLAWLWRATTMAIGVAGLLFLAAAAVAALCGKARRVLLAFAAVKLGVYVGWMMRHDEFRWVILDYGSAMLIVVCLLAGRARGGGRQARAAGWILGGIGVSGLGAAVQAGRLAPHPGFNHNDLYHVIQMAALALFYLGGRILDDAKSGRS